LTAEEIHYPTRGQLFLVMFSTFLLIILLEIMWGESLNQGKILLIESLTLLPVLIFVLVKKFSFRETFRWRKVGGHLLFVSGIIGLGLGVVIDEVDCLIQIFFPMPDELFQGMKEVMMFHSLGEFLIMILAVIFVAAFAEEMLFRGFFQGSLERNMDVPRAVFVASFVFTLLHFNPWWFVEILILSLILGVLVLRSGSIFPSVVVHAVNNAMAVFLINTNPATLDWYRLKGHVSPVWIILGLGCVVFGFRIFYGLTELPQSSTHEK